MDRWTLWLALVFDENPQNSQVSTSVSSFDRRRNSAGLLLGPNVKSLISGSMWNLCRWLCRYLKKIKESFFMIKLEGKYTQRIQKNSPKYSGPKNWSSFKSDPQFRLNNCKLSQIKSLIFNWGHIWVMSNYWATVFWTWKPQKFDQISQFNEVF